MPELRFGVEQCACNGPVPHILRTSVHRQTEKKKGQDKDVGKLTHALKGGEV